MKRQITILLHLLILLALSACATIPAGPFPTPSPTATTQPSRLPDPEDVKAFLVQLVDVEKRAPGIVVGMIAADPEERWVVGYGRLSATDNRVPDGDTVFEIGSITKVFTGILLAQAVLNDEVQLDDPISMYLPEGVTAPEYEGRSITLLDLATHTSGLPRDGIQIDYSTPDKMYAFLSKYTLTRAPGSANEYSNFGFSLLGDLLVRVAGAEDYEALLEDRITRPLGMDSTRIEVTPDMRSRLAFPHSTYSDITTPWFAPAFDPAGGIRSTANDMLKFLAVNMGLTETKLQPAIQLANTPQRPGENGSYNQGGRTMGYTSFLIWDSEREIGLVVLTNAFTDVSDVSFQLMRGLPKPFPVDPQVLAAYAGRYQDSDGGIVTIRVDNTRIFVLPPNKPEYELIASSENLEA
jgi:CubicO group peptidase (beta-lactamase class C family)